MDTHSEPTSEPRLRLNRERVLRAAVDIADAHGIETLSMRRLASDLSVEAMALYNHIKDKEDLLDGMVEIVLSEIDMSQTGTDWGSALRERSLSARDVMLRHSWAPGLLESRNGMSPTILRYFDSIIGMLTDGGFSIELIHHAMHAIGSHMLGFNQTLFKSTDVGPEEAAIMMRHGPTLEQYPNLTTLIMAVDHNGQSIVGEGCDALFEFEFGLDLIIQGLERIRTAS
ncbi:TetR/AcrR family transcriptional regulator C-terminal domain-containing protein [Acidimicrobiaceae bacterium AH-315-P05]|nr:TetR/AcrR family transcriptional regulator C-terminal domain-containing protein [Acidimicrobiaceae bacterium AH-315-P05]